MSKISDATQKAFFPRMRFRCKTRTGDIILLQDISSRGLLCKFAVGQKTQCGIQPRVQPKVKACIFTLSKITQSQTPSTSVLAGISYSYLWEELQDLEAPPSVKKGYQPFMAELNASYAD